MRIGTLMSVLAAIGIVLAGCATEAPKAEVAKPEAKVAAAPAEKPAPAPAPVAEAPEDSEPLPPGVDPATPAQSGQLPPMDKLDGEGFIRTWLILGPFPNPGERPDNQGYNTDYLKDNGGEAGHVPAEGMEIAGGGFKPEEPTPVKWQLYTSRDSKIDFAGVDFLKTTVQSEDLVVYAACWVTSETDQDVEVRVGSDDGYKLWIDHQHIGDLHDYRASERDQEIYKVSLKAGKRTLILIKVDQDWGAFDFLLRLVTADGQQAPGIKVSN